MEQILKRAFRLTLADAKCTGIPTNPLPASYLRGGTSKGVFIQRRHLPEDTTEWKPIFLGLMGSPDRQYGRQLNGMGGGVSSLSKVCVVEPPSKTQEKQGIDTVYTFVQVGIEDDTIDISGNCGNLSSMIGVYALDERIVPSQPKFDPERGLATVRSLNTNTNKIIDTTFPVLEETGTLIPQLDLPGTTIAGVTGKASPIYLDFVNPAGARTGKLLPSNEPKNEVDVEISGRETKLCVSLVDATNPTVFVRLDDICKALGIAPDPLDANRADFRAAMEAVRQRGAALMGLDPKTQGQPKVAALSAPTARDDESVDIVIHAFSMGVLHKAVPMTVGLCLGVASGTQGTIAWEIVQNARKARGAAEVSDLVQIRHPGGTVNVGAVRNEMGEVTSARVVRTGRRLMRGAVWW